MYVIMIDDKTTRELYEIKQVYKTNIIDKIGYNNVIPYSKRIINDKLFIDDPQVVQGFQDLNPIYTNLKYYKEDDENKKNQHSHFMTQFSKKLNNYEAHNILEEIDFRTDHLRSFIYLSSKTLLTLLGIEQNKNSFIVNVILYNSSFNRVGLVFANSNIFDKIQNPWVLEFYFRR